MSERAMTGKSLGLCVTGVALLAGIAANRSLGQAVINFNNNVLIPYANGDVIVRDADGTTPLTGSNFVARLYYGSSAQSLIPDTAAPARFRNVPTSDSFAGTWLGATRTLHGIATGTILVLGVQVWDATSGPTFEQATRR